MTLSRTALMFCFLSTTAQAEGTDWMVRTARMEGAAANIEETAAALKETAARVVASQRLGDMAELVSDAAELNRRVLAAGLAADVLDKSR
jgi:hypothetical protein